MKTSIMFCLLGILWFGCSHSSVGPNPNLTANTAKYKLPEVNSLAQSYGKGLRLMLASSENVNPDGTSDTWSFQYSDTSMSPESYWFHCKSNVVGFDSTSPTGVGTGFIDNRSWFNSDSALGIAERNGGSQFRAQNPRYTIVASVGIPVVPNPTTQWYIAYQSTENPATRLLMWIDANTGQVNIGNTK